jgi:hypothetical protein
MGDGNHPHKSVNSSCFVCPATSNAEQTAHSLLNCCAAHALLLKGRQLEQDHGGITGSGAPPPGVGRGVKVEQSIALVKRTARFARQTPLRLMMLTTSFCWPVFWMLMRLSRLLLPPLLQLLFAHVGSELLAPTGAAQDKSTALPETAAFVFNSHIETVMQPPTGTPRLSKSSLAMLRLRPMVATMLCCGTGCVALQIATWSMGVIPSIAQVLRPLMSLLTAWLPDGHLPNVHCTPVGQTAQLGPHA